MAADSTMFLIVNLLIALSFGVHLEQLEHRIGLTWPRPFLFRPLRVRQICSPGMSSLTILGRSLLDHDCSRRSIRTFCVNMQKTSIRVAKSSKGGDEFIEDVGCGAATLGTNFLVGSGVRKG